MSGGSRFFVVACCGFLDIRIGDVQTAHPHPTGDHKGPPSLASPPSPLLGKVGGEHQAEM